MITFISSSSEVVKELFWSISVEPVMLFFTGGFEMFMLLMVMGIINKICVQTFQRSDVEEYCANFKAISKGDETIMQQLGIQWKMYIALSIAVPLTVIGPLLGAYSDIHGRKINMLLGLSGAVLMCIMWQLEFYFLIEGPLFWVLIGGFFLSLTTGSWGSMYASSYAYVADETDDRSFLTFRYTGLEVCGRISSVIVSLAIGGLLSKNFSNVQGLLVVMCIFIVAFFYGLIFLKQLPPKDNLARANSRRATRLGSVAHGLSVERLRQLHQLNAEALREANEANSRSDSVASSAATTENGRSASLTSGVSSSNQALIVPTTRTVSEQQKKKKEVSFKRVIVDDLIMAAYTALTKNREGHLRSYIWLCTLVFFILQSSNSGVHIPFNYFASHSPIFWSKSDLAFYNGFASLMQLVGLILGLFLLKVLCLHETTILIISIISAMARCFLIGSATTGIQLYFAAVAGIICNVTFPVCKSLVCQFVERDEIGRVYGLFHIATDLSLIMSNLLFTGIYNWTLDSNPGFVFLVVEKLLFVSLCLMTWIHFDYKRLRAERMLRAHSVAHTTDSRAVVQ